jgi:hypothetical protein
MGRKRQNYMEQSQNKIHWWILCKEIYERIFMSTGMLRRDNWYLVTDA